MSKPIELQQLSKARPRSQQRMVRRHWNWNPMRPVKCTGGIVRFGAYFECFVDGQMTLQTPLQFAIKCSIGLVPPNDKLRHGGENQ